MRSRRARSPHTPFVRESRVAAAAMAALIPFVVWLERSRPPAGGVDTGDDVELGFEPEPTPRRTPGVHVALHLDEPIETGRSVVWTAAFQTAWDTLGDVIGQPGRIELGPPAHAEDVAALNSGRRKSGLVPPDALTVIAGPADDEHWSKIDAASDRGRPADAPAPRAIDALVFAKLKASIRYETPFHIHDRPILFGAAKTSVRAYGLQEDAEGPETERMRALVSLHMSSDPEAGERAAEAGVLEFRGVDGSRVIVSGRPPSPTLRATWDDARSVLTTSPGRSFESIDRLAIPSVAIDTGRSYDELKGAPILGNPKYVQLVVARQDVRLTANERGADVDAEATLVARGAIPLVVEITGPFLLAMLAPGQSEPYALAWIGTAEPLTPWGDPVGAPLSPASAKRFAGRWTLDPAASVEATVARWKDKFAAVERGSKTPAQVEADLRHEQSPRFEGRTLDLTIDAEGRAAVESSRRGKSPTTRTGQLTREGRRVRLVLPRLVDTSSGGIDESTRFQDGWTLSREGSRLILRGDDGATTVLVRR